MSLRARFTAELKEAMLAKNAIRVSTIRLINAALKDKDIAARPAADAISDDQILSMLSGMVKQRRESIEQYEKGNRPELAQIERDEITVIESFMPAQLSEEEIVKAVDSIITKVGATSVKDLGKVMADLKSQYAGQMDFTKASALAKGKLS